MFSKTALASLVLGVLYVNALAVPVAREPAPEPEYQELMARAVDYDLFSREPEAWAQWAEAVRDQASKREPSPLFRDIVKNFINPPPKVNYPPNMSAH